MDADIDAKVRAARCALYRMLMRLGLRYTIYEDDLVVIERPNDPSLFVVDLTTGVVETVGQ